MSPELRLIARPRATYAALARMPAPPALLAAVRRPLLVTVVIGVAVAMTATGRVTPALVLSTSLTWSYIVLLQLAIALPMITPAARRTVGVARAVDLFFAGHAPWSLFILLLAAVAPPPLGWPVGPYLEIAAIVPLVLTARIVAAFFAEVLAMDARRARRMTIVHQAITWLVFLTLNWVQSSFTPRILELWRL